MASVPPPPPPPPKPAAPTAASVVPLRRQVAAWLGKRPTAIDAAMLFFAATSYYLHGYGVGLKEILASWVLWILLWVGWARARGGPLGPVVSIAAFVVILFGSPSWQLGYELQSECLQERADEALAEYDAESPWLGPGNCGPLQWSQQSVHLNSLRRDPDGAEVEPALVVWFTGAGTTNWVLFGGNALVYSPEGEPRCNRSVGSSVSSCEANALGDGWYYLRYSTGIN